MQYTQITGTDLSVSRICLGTMTFGNPVKEQDAIDLIQYASQEHGINFIDTANMYEGYDRYNGSAGGVAECIIGKAVKGHRENYVIATKVGMTVGSGPADFNTSPEAIYTQLRKSLERLDTDYVDIYYLHKYDPDTPPGEIAIAMGKELKAGTILSWGVSNYTKEQLENLLRAVKEENITAPVLNEAQISLLNTSALDDLLPYCAEEGIGTVPYQVLQGGMLTGKYHRGQQAPEHSRLSEKPEWMKPFTDDVYDVIENCEREAKKNALSMTQYAISWASKQTSVVSVLVGVKNRKQIDEAAEVFG